MTIPYPPRREPRVLAVTCRGAVLNFAVIDPWEVRSAGSLELSRRGRRLALRRLVRRERPTAVVATTAKLSADLAKACHGLCPVLAARSGRVLPIRVATELYPDLPLFAPSQHLLAAARLAIWTLLFVSLPSRPYAPHRH